ncbi:MAG: hypothetical protein NVS4B6_07730 [Mycobacterium sp.]
MRAAEVKKITSYAHKLYGGMGCVVDACDEMPPLTVTVDAQD